MSKKSKKKYYVVWQGQKPGIYETWEECKAQTQGINGAKYKSYDTLESAEEAYKLGWQMAASMAAPSESPSSILTVNDEGMTVVRPQAGVEPPVLNAIAVDAACSGNPGVMEYQGVFIATRTQLFHFKAPLGTNNIGEFLAIVHGLAYIKKHHLEQMILYSDSVNAMKWVAEKCCRTKLQLTPETEQLYDVIRRAEAWLHNNTYTTEIRKWDTEKWGEIPADFNRK